MQLFLNIFFRTCLYFTLLILARYREYEYGLFTKYYKAIRFCNPFPLPLTTHHLTSPPPPPNLQLLLVLKIFFRTCLYFQANICPLSRIWIWLIYQYFTMIDHAWANESDFMFSLKQPLWNFADSLQKIMFSLFLHHLPNLTACIIYTHVL